MEITLQSLVNTLDPMVFARSAAGTIPVEIWTTDGKKLEVFDIYFQEGIVCIDVRIEQ